MQPERFSFVFFTILNQNEFRIATVAMFTCDLYAGSRPPHDLERLRTTMQRRVVDFVRVGYFIPLNGPYNRHPPSISSANYNPWVKQWHNNVRYVGNRICVVLNFVHVGAVRVILGVHELLRTIFNFKFVVLGLMVRVAVRFWGLLKGRVVVSKGNVEVRVRIMFMVRLHSRLQLGLRLMFRPELQLPKNLTINVSPPNEILENRL